MDNNPKRLKLDDKQFRYLLELLKPNPTRISWLDPLSKIIQVAAIIFAGIWAFYEYLSFKKEFNQLTLSQQELAIASAKLTQNSTQIANQLSTVQLTKSTRERLKYDTELKVEWLTHGDDGEEIYDATLTFKTTNISDIDVELSYVIVEYFLGDLLKESSSPKVIAINSPVFQPSKKMYWPTHPGPIEWKKIGSQAFSFIEARSKVSQAMPDIDFSATGFAVGKLGNGETTWTEQSYLVRGRPGQYVSFGITSGINRKFSGKYVRLESKDVILPEVPRIVK